MLEISQAFLYICLAILTGTFVLYSVPAQKRPEIVVPKKWLLSSAVAIPILSFVAVIEVIINLGARIGYLDATLLVLSSTTVGLAWVMTLAFSIMLIILVARGMFARFGLLIMVILMMTLAWGSHATSMNFTTGIISDFLHTIAMSVWVGTLFVVSFFAKNTANWLAFLKWFSIVAAASLFTIIISGLILMGVLVPSYVTSWLTNYGQGLFLKHMFIVPIVLLAFANMIIARFMLKRDMPFNPLPWVRIESSFLMIILIITAFFTQQQPPVHELTQSMVSPVFQWLHGGAAIDGDTVMNFAFSGVAVAFLSLATISLCIFLMSFLIRQIPAYVTFILGFIAAVSTYVFVMKSIVLL